MSSLEEKQKALAAIAIISIIKKRKKECNENKPRKRSCWVKPWIARRKAQGSFSNLLNELRLEDKNSFRSYLRMNETAFFILLNLVKEDISKEDTVLREAITAEERLALTLRFLATGETMHSLHFQFRLGVSTVHSIVYETCRALFNNLRERYLPFPQSEKEWLKIASDFETTWQFNHCIGALDGKHIEIFSPPHSGSYFFNYKQTFSIVLLALVDANLKAIYVDIGTNGRVHDSSVMNNSSLGKRLVDKRLNLPKPEPLPGRKIPIPYVIVADAAFSMHENLMRPYSQKELLNDEIKIYNYRHSRARRVSENFFGLLAQRFRFLLKRIQALPENVEVLVLAAVALHNFLMENDSVGLELEGNSENVTKKTLQPLANQGCRPSSTAKLIRKELASYFSNEGAVDWQYNKIN